MQSLLILALACAPLSLPLDDSMQRPETFSDFLTRDTAMFMLQGLVRSPATSVVDDGDEWKVDCNKVKPELLPALAETLAFDGTLDPSRLRRVFVDNYLGTIAERAQDVWVKPKLADFLASTNFTAWDDLVIPRSSIKRMTRRIFRSPEGFTPAISVSQTLDSVTGDISAPVRETEVGILREDGRNWDFYAYNSEGNLSSFSTFPGGERPSPEVCIACHYSAGSRAVDRFFP